LFTLWSAIKKIMGGISRGFDWWWSFIKNLFQIGEFNVTGSIVLGPGVQEIVIGTDFPNPTAVFVGMSEPNDAVTTCLGDLNWVAARLVDHGFILYANITSSSCRVDYIVKYDTNTTTPQADA